ncbi:mitogen-activated protein kinase HOG1 [Penicillium lividum]|nr:mitogen-activated protein kinase HOG1 [Penicillium lividum]
MAYFVPYYASKEPVEVARDRIRQQNVMLTEFAAPFATKSTAKRIYREIITLKHLKHGNIINLIDIFISPSEDIYFISDLMETDLKTLMGARVIEKEYVQYIFYQIMRGLKFAHSAGVFHRDLKPSQMLVNQNCDLKIFNFGVADAQKLSTTAYGSIMHYKSPEVLLSTQSYDGPTDIWSAGCIFAEMLMGKPLFPGDNSIHQLHAIAKLLGSPPDLKSDKKPTRNVSARSSIAGKTTYEWILPTNAARRASSDNPSWQNPDVILLFPRSEGKALSSVLPPRHRKNFVPTAAAIDVLQRMIVFEPHERVTATEALTSHYLAPYHDSTDEPEAENMLDWRSVEADHPLKAWKAKVLAEVQQCNEQAKLQETVWSWLQVQT